MIVVRHDMVSVTGYILPSKGFGFCFFDAFQDFFQLVVVLVIEFDVDILKLFGSGSTNFVNAVVEERIFFPNRFMIIGIIWMIHNFVILGFVVMDHKEVKGSLRIVLSAVHLVVTSFPDIQFVLPFLCRCRIPVGRRCGCRRHDARRCGKDNFKGKKNWC